jgi:hypothetical protein
MAAPEPPPATGRAGTFAGGVHKGLPSTTCKLRNTEIVLYFALPTQFAARASRIGQLNSHPAMRINAPFTSFRGEAWVFIPLFQPAE